MFDPALWYHSRFSRLFLPVAVSILVAACSTEPGRDGAGTLRWRFEAGGEVFSSPSVAADGTIHITASNNATYAVDSYGRQRWVRFFDYPFFSSPVVRDDGSVCLGDADSNLIVLTVTGAPDWVFTAPAGDYVSAPTINSSGTILYGQGPDPGGTEWGLLYSVEGPEMMNWAVPMTDYSSHYSPVMGSDDTLYMLYRLGLIAFDSVGGDREWTFTIPGEVTSWAPAMLEDGTILFGATDGVYAVTASGELLWKYDMSNDRVFSPVVGSDGTIYVGTGNNTGSPYQSFFALDSGGSLLWSYSSYAGASTPLIGADGVIYWATGNGELLALNRDSTLAWKFELSRDEWSAGSPAMGSDGTLYIGTVDGYLYAIRTDSGGLLDSGWPRFRGNNSNDGRAG